MMELAWIVLDDSGSLTSYDERIRRIHSDLRDELECSFDVTSWTTSSSFGMGPLSARPIGSGGGDGISKIFDQLITHDSAYTRGPCFIVYLTDGEANLTPDVISAIKRRHVVLIDILDPRWDDKRIGQSLIDLDNFLLHDCDEDCCECNPDRDCACDTDGACLAGFEGGDQPFYPNWRRQTGFHFGTNQAAWTHSVAEAMHKISTQGHIAYLDELYTASKPPEAVVGPFKHPVDEDLNVIAKLLNCMNKRDKLEVRARLGVELNMRLKKIIGGNTLTPAQQARIRTTYVRILTECLDIPIQSAINASETIILNPNTITQVQEGQPMSAQITTTVSLKTSNQSRATLADLKTLITEVERVGGTDESFVDFDAHRRTGCLDAVVVTAVAVEVTPTLDPRVECVLTIQDDEKRTHALVDLLIDYPRLRSQITPHLVNKPEAKPAAKKTTAAKPAKA